MSDWNELPARPGPGHILLERLHAIGWKWLNNGWVLDHEAQPLDLLHGSQSEVHQRLLDGWQSFVQGCVSKRKTFHGMEWISVPLTLENTSKLAASKLGLLRKVFNGTFFTADTQAHNQNAHTLLIVSIVDSQTPNSIDFGNAAISIGPDHILGSRQRF